ncbi:MAG: hypothetical protein EAZ15_05855 [Sphingobacteriales bacterium]|nr:MAG: hypothetical protein EAZ15_05855 [Sphingobacteriales bacterium]
MKIQNLKFKIKNLSLRTNGLLLILLFSGCYSFTGGSITPGMKTVSVPLFENSAPLVVPTLSQAFTETLKDRIRTQSPLSFVRTDGQASFNGRITGYDIRPVAIQGNNSGLAGQTRLTITVQIKYSNSLKPDENFDQSFSRFQDFKGSLSSQEQSLIKNINLQLSEDIYNRAFANW